jgi:hypothetical protein
LAGRKDEMRYFYDVFQNPLFCVEVEIVYQQEDPFLVMPRFSKGTIKLKNN